MENEKLELQRVTTADVDVLSTIMKRAFDEDTRRHLGLEAGGPPGYDNGDFIRKWYFESNAESYTIHLGERVIGGLGIFKNPNHEYFLGNIFIDPDVEDKGIGSRVWKLIEKQYPDATKWMTETPGFSKRNHNFYVNKCGFHVIRIDNPKDPMEASFILEKRMTDNGGM